MSKPSLIHHVSDTAFLVAHHRATESARPDALFSDPLAERLAGARGAAIANSLPTAKMSAWTLAVRTVVIDRFISEAITREAGGVDVVVNLGAGLDTRPYRMDLPRSLLWIEVDYPEVIAFKEQHLAGETPRCRLERIGQDLADVPARRALLRQLDARGQRLLVLTEGVLPYLDVAEAGALADDLRAMPHVGSWIIDYLSPQTMAYTRRKGLGRNMGQAQFKFEPGDWFGFFAQHGWRRREIRYLGIEGARLGRRAPLPWMVRLIVRVSRALARGRRAEGGLETFSGYAVLEPA